MVSLLELQKRREHNYSENTSFDSLNRSMY